MKEADPVRSKWLHIRLTEEEYKKIDQKFRRSTCRKRSEFARSILLDKTVTVYIRNQSLDECMEELILLREELSFLLKTFETMVAGIDKLQKREGYNEWFLLYEKSRQDLLQKVNVIQEKISKISEVWLQS